MKIKLLVILLCCISQISFAQITQIHPYQIKDFENAVASVVDQHLLNNPIDFGVATFTGKVNPECVIGSITITEPGYYMPKGTWFDRMIIVPHGGTAFVDVSGGRVTAVSESCPFEKELKEFKEKHSNCVQPSPNRPPTPKEFFGYILMAILGYLFIGICVTVFNLWFIEKKNESRTEILDRILGWVAYLIPLIVMVSLHLLFKCEKKGENIKFKKGNKYEEV